MAWAEPLVIQSSPLKWFKGREVGQSLGNSSLGNSSLGNGLIWRGGLVLESENKRFGGLSDLTFTSLDGDMAIVTDTGRFITGQLLYDQNGAPAGIANASISRIKNSKGVNLPTIFSRDPEAIDVIYRRGKPIGVRVGFEHLTRVADFALLDAIPGGAAKPYTVPKWLLKARHNNSIEALCIAPSASPIAGSTLFITEDMRDKKGNDRAWLSGKRDGGNLAFKSDGSYHPTSCQFLPNGDLLVLSRSVGLLGFSMKLWRFDRQDVRADNLLKGQLLLVAAGRNVDNMEGLASHTGPRGETLISLLSDDNFNGWQRTLLLQFELGPAPN